MNGTRHTRLNLVDGKYKVSAGGGYDGFLTREFDDVADAVDFIAYLWGLGTAAEFYPHLR